MYWPASVFVFQRTRDFAGQLWDSAIQHPWAYVFLYHGATTSPSLFSNSGQAISCPCFSIGDPVDKFPRLHQLYCLAPSLSLVACSAALLAVSVPAFQTWISVTLSGLQKGFVFAASGPAQFFCLALWPSTWDTSSSDTCPWILPLDPFHPPSLIWTFFHQLFDYCSANRTLILGI